MAGCFGKLFKKRSKSLPTKPVSNQGNKNTNVRKNEPTKPIQTSATNKSLPSLTRADASQSNSELHKIAKSQSEDNLNTEDLVARQEIYPVPERFRESEANKTSMAGVVSTGPDETTDSYDSNHEEGATKRSSKSKKSHHESERIDYMRELGKELNDELKKNYSPRSSAKEIGAGSYQKQPDFNVETANLGFTGRSSTIQNESLKKSGQVSFKSTNEAGISLVESNPNFMLLQAGSVATGNNQISLEEIQKLVENFFMDKNSMEELKTENDRLNSVVESMQREIIERDKRFKEENDLIVNTVHNTLSREMKTETEREALVNYVTARQSEKNETLIKEQNKLIEMLKIKCANLEKEIKSRQVKDQSDLTQIQIRDLKSEINALRNIVYRLNIELSLYQSKYPSPSLQAGLKEKIELKELPNNGQIPVWLVNTKYLSPLIAAYDDRLIEKEDKLKFFKKKIDDLTSKFKTMIDENNQLHSRIDRAAAGQRAAGQDVDESEINKIKHHALLVLEENKSLNEQNDLLRLKFVETQKKYLQEIGEISKRVIILESERTDLSNRLESIKTENSELVRKLNEKSVEVQKRVKLDDHLSQISELKRKIDEINSMNKLEMSNTVGRIQEIERERKELQLRNSQLTNETKKLLAENQVLEKALNDGIGRKAQNRVKRLEQKFEIAQLKEKTAYACLNKLAAETERLQKEKDIIENTLESYRVEMKKNENKVSEKNLKAVKLETKLEDVKEKSARKISEVIEKLKSKDSEQTLIRLEYEKKIDDLLSLLKKKQDQIEELHKEKRQLETEVEVIWQTTNIESQRLKENMLEHLNRNQRSSDIMTSSHFKLLLDD